MEATGDTIADVRSVAEAIDAGDGDNDFPLYEIESLCMRCGITRLLLTMIPHFRKILLSAFECPHCGERNNKVQFAGELQPKGCNYNLKFQAGDLKMLNRQVLKSDSATIKLKPGGRIPEKGKKITVCVKNIKDLSRDVIKSDTASVRVPELDLELASGTLGGIVTTVEGLITKISENLERVHGFTFGDSIDEFKKSKWQNFRTRLEKLLKLEETWTLIIDDVLANSFVAPVTDEIEDDHQLSFEEYERSWEQNEELGLNDMDTSSADVACNSPSTTANQELDGK